MAGVGQQLAPRLTWAPNCVWIFQKVTFPINLAASCLLVVVFTCWKCFFFFHWMFIPPKSCHCQMFWKLLGEPCYWLVSFCYCRECRQMRRKNRKSHDDRWNKWDCEVYNIWLTLSCDLYMSKITLKYQARYRFIMYSVWTFKTCFIPAETHPLRHNLFQHYSYCSSSFIELCKSLYELLPYYFNI